MESSRSLPMWQQATDEAGIDCGAGRDAGDDGHEGEEDVEVAEAGLAEVAGNDDVADEGGGGGEAARAEH